jgi:UDP-GlcNAc3NAcA epimerase
MRLRFIVDALARLTHTMAVVLPLHPRTRERLRALNDGRGLTKGICVVDPVGFVDMASLEKNAAVIVTDSGGVQKEAFFHRVPCVTLRTETEWEELVELGWNRLAPPVPGSALDQIIFAAAGSRGADASPYGDGHAAARIVERLSSRTLT